MSISSTEDAEENFTNQFTNSYDYENTYEGKDSQYHDPFQDIYQHDLVKDQQIKVNFPYIPLLTIVSS